MKILITEIPPQGLNIKITGESRQDISAKVSLYEAELRFFKKDSDIVITGHIFCNLETQCSRCLSNFLLPIDTFVDFTVKPIKEIAIEGCYEIQKEDLDVSFYTSNLIDVDDIVNEQLALNIPMKPLCKLDCKGLCVNCGADFNQMRCNCSLNTIDERLKILEKLIKKE
ncbi:MAG: DUF177 domain-containing protein [Thermodesulfovibrionales bacterium]|nr:DUF177 domain-containing protein [Thermodesulfovibrionales bacterium]